MSILYSDFMNKKKKAERMDMSMVDVVQSVTKKVCIVDRVCVSMRH